MEATAEQALHFHFFDCAATADPLTLAPEDVHVWQSQADSSASLLSQARGHLSEAENERAARFRVAKPRGEFLLGRALLRTLLGSYLRVPAADLQFTFSAHGKPELSSPAHTGISFNLSHSGRVVLLAFARGRKIGVDVECIRADFSTDEIAERFFSQAERLALRQVPQALRPEAFFRCWTRKEAYIKARGEGLSHPLHQFDVSLEAERPALLGTRPDPAEARRWLLRNVPVPVGYVGALAVQADSAIVRS